MLDDYMERERRKIIHPTPEEEHAPVVDISDRVRELLSLTGPAGIRALRTLGKELENVPNVTLTLDYTTLEHAKFIKRLLESEPPGKRWTFSIRATESQMKEAANAFASGVEWIPVE